MGWQASLALTEGQPFALVAAQSTAKPLPPKERLALVAAVASLIWSEGRHPPLKGCHQTRVAASTSAKGSRSVCKLQFAECRRRCARLHVFPMRRRAHCVRHTHTHSKCRTFVQSKCARRPTLSVCPTIGAFANLAKVLANCETELSHWPWRNGF